MGTPGRRLSPQERRQEMIVAALDLADAVGLDRLTSRDIGAAIGVAPGLVHHYFSSMDELIVEAFTQFAAAENDTLQSITQLPALPALCGYVARQLNVPTRSARIWMSAWVAAPRRPELATEVDRRMLEGLDRLASLLARGTDEGVFDLPDPRASAFRILVLLDGVLVQISMRAEKSYGDVTKLVWETVEREVGLAAGTLSGQSGPAAARGGG